MAVCQNCGKENSPQATACVDCGSNLGASKKAKFAGTMLGMPSPVAENAASEKPASEVTTLPAPRDETRTANRKAFAGTMMGMPSPVAQNATPDGTSSAATPAPAPLAKEAAAANKKAFAGTMMGMPSPVIATAAPQGAQGEPSAEGSPKAARKPAAFGQTMVGMGAPDALANPAPLEKPAAQTPGPVDAAPPNRKFQGTLLGVAQPGIAPSPGGAPAPPSTMPVSGPGPGPGPSAVSPAIEPPLINDYVDKPFQSARPVWKSVSMILGGMLAAGIIGGTFALLSPKPVTVIVEEFAIDENGNDQLKLKCEECPEGSELILGESKAPVKDRLAILTPQKPLALGRNELEFTLQANGESRDVKKVILPIAFRVLTKWTGLHEDPPHAEISVAAPEGSKVSIGGKATPLTAQKAVLRVDFSEETSGESAKVARVESSYDVIVTVEGKARETKAELKNGITPLTLTSPSSVHQLGGKPLAISGRTTAGARIKLGDVAIEADEKGMFSHILEAPSAGKLVVTSSAEKLLSRRVEIELTDSVPDPKNAVSKFSDIKPGVTVNLKASVIESRTAGGTTQALVEVENGCGAPPCLLRAVYGESKKLPPNRVVRIIGTVAAGSPLTVRVSRFR